MTTAEWESRWIKYLTDGGTPYGEAMKVFNVCSGNQDIDMRINPAEEAKSFLPNQLLHHKNNGFRNGWKSSNALDHNKK